MQTFNKMVGACALALAGFAPAASHAQLENTSFTIGLKTWVTNWNTWFTQSYITPSENFVVVKDVFNRKAETELTFIPQLTVRNGPWLISGSALAQKDFTFFLSSPATPASLSEISFERKEYDVNFGYALAAGAIVTLGWKDLKYSNNGFSYRAKGGTIGVTGSAPLAGGVAMYGTIGYGRPKIEASSNELEDSRGTYILTEVGVAVPLGQWAPDLRTTVVTAGYRYQRLESGRVTTSTFNVNTGQNIGERAVELVDVTEGFTLGVSFTF